MTKYKITAVLGPTNTGKTHLAIDTMLSFDSGMIGFPLRLLAREVYDKVIKKIGLDKVALIGIAFSGYWFRPLEKYEQIVIGIGSLFFVAPGIESMVFGFLIISPTLFLQFGKKNHE